MEKRLKFGVALITMLGLFATFFWGCKTEELATLKTIAASEISANSAMSGGNILYDGGGEMTSRGIVWATHESPSINQHLGITSDGVGPGFFYSNITNLSPGTTYYVRAYAVNGIGTAFGNQVSFTTLILTPRDTQTQIVDVINPKTGKTWMDRNLGASRAATSSTDPEAYGDLYQWGRAADGHQKRTSGTTSFLSNKDTPEHGYFILPFSMPLDWRYAKNDNLWQGVNGVNNPCPPGYRLPTEAELNAEQLSWSSDGRAGAFASPLKLPVAGARRSSDGSLHEVSSLGYYWSSGVDGFSSRGLRLYSDSAYIGYYGRAYGYSVRCIKN